MRSRQKQISQSKPDRGSFPPANREQMPIEILLPRLTRVTQLGPGQWRARCPNPQHPDHNPSLSVAETPDGTVLVYCWSADCDVETIAEAGAATVSGPEEFEPIVLVAMVAWAIAAWFVLFVLRLVFRPAG